MNRRAAQAKAREETLSIGELRRMIWAKRQAMGAAGTTGTAASVVNPAIPLLKTLDIYTAALAGRSDDEVPKAWAYDVYKRRDRPSKDYLIIVNILRDAA